MKYELKLFKHPNTFEAGDAIDTRPITAPSASIAIDLAQGEIAAAPRSAFSHPDDRFVLINEDGEKISEWYSDEAATFKGASDADQA